MIDNSEQLKKIRKERGLTLQAVCDGADIPIRTYQNYEYGKREISAEALYKLAKFYGVTTDYLLGLEPPPPPADAMEVLGIEKSVDDDKFMKLYNELPDYAKQIFVDTMAKLAQATTSNPKKQFTRPPKPVEPPEQVLSPKPNIQISQSPARVIARSKSNPFCEAPTPEQIASFTPVPEDSDL